MTSSHAEDGPSGHPSTPQPQPQPQPQAQSQSGPADGQPTASENPPASDRPSNQSPVHASHVDETTTTTNQEPTPSRNLPPSSDTPAHPAQASTTHGDGDRLRRDRDDDHMNKSGGRVENWLQTTNQLSSQLIHDGPAEHVASFDDAAAAAAIATAVDSNPHNGLHSDFANPDVAMLGKDIPQDFVQGLPADLPVTEDAYLPISSENLALSWPLPGSFAFQPGVFQPGVSVSQGNDEDMSDDDGASLDEAVLDGTGFERMARLEFADTFVAITTNTTIIGRDQRVYKRAVLNKKRAEGGLSPVSRAVPQKRGHYSKSYVSQEGGALGPESDGEGRSRSSKRRRTIDNGQYTLSPKQATPAAEDPSAPDKVISSRQYVDHTPGAVPVDMENLRPSSDDVARIDIHGAGPDIIETSKGISREHLKIQYDEENRVWQATAIGRNGFFCEEKLYHKDEVVTLRSGSHLQIQAVGFIFTISGVEDGKLGNEGPRAFYEDGKKMSLDFSNSRDGSNMQDTDDTGSSPIPTATAILHSDDSDGEPDRAASPKPATKDVARKAESQEQIRPTIESDSVKEPTQSVEPGASQAVMPPKKRGPGRPPKNGVMSKREERELKKKREEEDKKNNPPQEPGDPPPKRKVGRPRKHPRPEDEGDQPEKRKYKPRKPKNEDGEEEEDPEGDKADKQKRLQKPKTPPLDLGRKEDYTEEQLQKPNKNYQMLIDEVLNEADIGLTLKQIYKRIAKQYPYFHFCVDTKGWESSVRHNLIGSHCFEKNQETHLWSRVKGIPLESGKKRKPSDTAAEQRAPPIYNGNFNPPHGYQQPPHPQQYSNQHMVPTGGGPPMNGMPRYQPSAQAHQAPIPNSTHPGTAPSQQPGTRPGFPQQIPPPPPPPQQQQQQHPHPQAPATVPQASTYAAAAGPPKSQYPSTQQQHYSSGFNQRPQQTPLAHGTAAGTQQTQIHPQNSFAGRPGQGAPPTSQRGPATVHAGPMQQNQRAPTLPHPPQPVSNSSPAAALGPAVEPSLREFLGKFSSEVVKQLQGRVKRPHAVAVSVINRGLGLTDMSLAPEHENFEKAIINIFHTHKLTYSRPKATPASTAAMEPSKPPSSTTAPTVNGSSAAATTRPVQAAPSSVHATSISGPNGSAPSGSAPNGSAPSGSVPNGSAPSGSSPHTSAPSAPGTAANNVNGSLTAASAAPNGTTALGHNESSTTGPAATGPTAPSSTTTVGAGNPFGSSTGPQPNGAPKVNSPVPSRSSATPAPGTPAPDANNVQLLDSKLVEVIQQYKKLSQQVLIPQVGQLQAEILVMSAVNRVLGFTTESIVPHTAQSAKLGLREAEDALINSLKPRIDTYLRNKQAPSMAPSAAPASSTPTPVHATSTMPLPVPAPSR